MEDSVDQMLERVAQQPVDIALCTTGIHGYRSGVWKVSDGCCSKINHAVSIVGYKLCDSEGDDYAPKGCTVDKWWYSCQEEKKTKKDEKKCIPYWIIQNSWSEHWGDEGFIRIEMIDGEGLCAVNTKVKYGDWKDMY